MIEISLICLLSGEQDHGTLVRALASHQCGLGLISRVDTTFGLSYLIVGSHPYFFFPLVGGGGGGGGSGFPPFTKK